MVEPVRLGGGGPGPVLALLRGSGVLDAVPGDDEHRVGTALAAARTLGVELPLPGRGATVTLWEALATLGALDLTVARVLEPHLDAHAILQEARAEGRLPAEVLETLPSEATWGVFAAEGPGARLTAVRTAAGWRLDGRKPWCSLADRLSHALVTAWVDQEHRGVFVVDLHHRGVGPVADGPPWVARGLSAVTSAGLQLEAVPAVPVGESDWYLRRPGFAWGGIGVAAVWYGAAVGLGRRLREAADRRPPDQVALVALGAVDVALHRARSVLHEAAVDVDAHGASMSTASATLLAARARQVVADTAEEVLQRVGHALGPAPLTHEEEHARRVADLGVYLRQHHADRDLAALATTLTTSETAW